MDTTIDMRSFNEIQYYFAEEKRLMHTQYQKALKFIEKGCIKQIDPVIYECLPIKNYNVTTYKMIKDIDGLKCNCQYSALKHKKCSHILALEIWMKMRG